MKAGEEFELYVTKVISMLVAGHQATVEHDVKLDGQDGEQRQFDVVIRSTLGPFSELVTVVECKDQARIVDIKAIDGFVSVMSDVRANKGVVITRKGFSKNATRKAARHGIDLFTVGAFKASPPALPLPIYVREFIPHDGRTNIEIRVSRAIDREESMDGLLHEVELAIFDELKARAAIGDLHGGTVVIPSDRLPKAFVDSAGAAHPVEDMTVELQVAERHFMGFTHDLEQAVLLRNHADGGESEHHVFHAEDLILNYREAFAEFKSREDIGVVPVIELGVIDAVRAAALRVARIVTDTSPASPGTKPEE